MDPLLWGPCIWKTLFSVSFNCTTDDIPQVQKVLKLLEKVIPCPTCRAHYTINRQKADLLHPLKTKESIPQWLWYIKSLVNKQTKKTNTEFKYIKMRYNTFGHDICDTELCDALVFMSICIKVEDMKKLHEFIFALGNLLRFIRGQLPALLQCTENAYPSTILSVTNNIRLEYGYSKRDLSHYKNILEDSKLLE